MALRQLVVARPKAGFEDALREQAQVFIKALVEQCPDLKVEIEGHASGEGEAKHNQYLSEIRAERVKTR